MCRWSSRRSTNSIVCSAYCACAVPKTSSRQSRWMRSNGSSRSGTPRGAGAILRRPTASATTWPDAVSCWKTLQPGPVGNESRGMTTNALQMTSNSPQIKMPLPGPRARAIIDRDHSVVSPSYTRGYPLVMARGSGAMVEDEDGNVFLDCAAGIAVNSTGHSHPEVVRAITEQAGKFLHMSGTDFYYEQ